MYKRNGKDGITEILSGGGLDSRLAEIYGVPEDRTAAYAQRFLKAVEGFEKEFPDNKSKEIGLFTAPGRTEIGGNHTDHQLGCVLAGSVDMDIIAAAAPNGRDDIRFYSEGYGLISVNLNRYVPQMEETGTTAALIRGVAAKLASEQYPVLGFDAYCISDVPGGSGLSSSAAFETLIGNIVNHMDCEDRLTPVQIAKIGQYTENIYFGKPSGLMDQMASSAGGLVYIDFQNDDPEVREISYDFAAKGYALVVVNSGGSHDNLTEFYAAIPQEMRAVAACFGETYLRRVQPEQFMQMVPQLRERLKNVNADRAILRAAHYFAENRRVADEVSALQADDLNAFLRLVIESGRSSFCYLQNIFATPDRQELSLALMLAESKLHKDGAWRVHGGGFAGTTLNFVPKRSLDSFVKEMEAVFGAHSCNVLDIRPVGPACIRLGL